MQAQGYIYFLFGLALVVLFGAIIFYYYSKKRHHSVEEAKYRMLEDDED